MSDAAYLGDSVYIEPDDFGALVLYLNNGETDTDGKPLRKNKIVLEIEVIRALQQFLRSPADK